MRFFTMIEILAFQIGLKLKFCPSEIVKTWENSNLVKLTVQI